MARPKIDPDALHRYLDADHSQADAARHFGVSEAAISQRVRKLQIATSKVVTLEKAHEIVNRKLDANARLERVQRVIDDELSWAVDQAQQPGADRAKLQELVLKCQGRSKTRPPGGEKVDQCTGGWSGGLRRS